MIINIEINKLYLRIISLYKNNKYISIENDININQNLQYETLFIEELCKKIKQSIIISKKCKLLFNIQTEDIIVRNIYNINISNKKDILGIIKYNINQNIPINLDDYDIRYKVLEKNNNIGTVQMVLCPKVIIKLCYDIAKNLGIKAKILNINFDILQKLINLGIISNFDPNTLFIECRDDKLLLNKVVNNIIYESYILQRNMTSIEYIKSISEEYKNIYFYGNLDLKDSLKIPNTKLNAVTLDMEKLTLDISKDLDQEVSKYINAIGIVI